MSRLAYHLPRVIGLALAIAAAAVAYGLHSLHADKPATAADAALSLAPTPPSCDAGEGFTSHPPDRHTAERRGCIKRRRHTDDARRRRKPARCPSRRRDRSPPPPRPWHGVVPHAS